MGNNRSKGHRGERFYMRIFKALGFKKTITARLGSRLFDNCNIDLMFLPFNIQIKDGYKSLNRRKILEDMGTLMKEHFEEDAKEHAYPKLLIHRMKKTEGKRERQEHDDLVTMSFKDFVKILSINYNVEEHEDYNALGKY